MKATNSAYRSYNSHPHGSSAPSLVNPAMGLFQRNLRMTALTLMALAIVLWSPGLAGAQSVTFTGTSPVTLLGGFQLLDAVVVDSAGDLFVDDGATNAVEEIMAVNGSIPASNPTIRTLGSGFYEPAGMALDAAGDLFIADEGNNAVKEIVAVNGSIPASNPTIRTLGSGFINPVSVAVDAAGDVFVADSAGFPAVEEIVAVNGSIPASNPSIVDLSNGFSSPGGIALDSAGDLFVADDQLNGVYELVAVNGKIPTSGAAVVPLPGNFSAPVALAFDAAGDLFVSQIGSIYIGGGGERAVLEIVAVNGSAADSNTILTLGNGLISPGPLAVNAAGTVFVSDFLGGFVNGNYIEDSALKSFQAWNANFGSANVCPNGQMTPAPCSQTVTLNYSIAAGTTVGSIKDLTAGAPNLDFKAESGDTSSTLCTAGTYASTTACTLDVTFAPTAPGQRQGAVEIRDDGGNGLSTTEVYGEGIGAAAAFTPSTTIALSNTSFNSLDGVALDAAGDVFVAGSIGYSNNVVQEIVASNGSIPSNPTIRTLGSGFNNPMSVAVDGAGDVFVADTGNSAVKEIVAVDGSVPASNPTILTLGSGFSYPYGVAADAVGDIFVADTNNNAVKEILTVDGSIPANPTVLTLGGDFSSPEGVAVDALGDVYVADARNNAVKEILAVDGAIPASNPTILTLGSDFNYPSGVAVDAAGDVFVADSGNTAVKEIIAGVGSSTITLGEGFSPSGVTSPYGIAVDAAGDVYVGNTSTFQVDEIERSLGPSLSFPATSTTSGFDNTQSVQVQNVGNASLIATGAFFNGTNFGLIPGFGDPPDCTTGSPITSGASCNLSFDFAPQASGSLADTFTLSDNAPSAAQTIRLSGYGIGPLSVSCPASTASQGFSYSSKATALGGLAPFTFSIASGALPPGLSIGANGAIAGTPQSVNSSNFTVQVVDSQNTTAAQNCSIQVNGTPTAQVSATTLTFPNLAYPGSETMPLTVTNVGVGTLTFSPSINGPSYSIESNGCTGGVTAGNSCTLVVEFKPVDVGVHDDTLKLTTNGPTNPSIHLVGKGTGIGATSSQLNYGDVGYGSSSTLLLTILDQGVPGPVSLTETITGQAFVILHNSQNTCDAGFTTHPETCTLPIEFNPTSMQTYNETMTVTASHGTSPPRVFKVKLIGVGVNPNLIPPPPV